MRRPQFTMPRAQTIAMLQSSPWLTMAYVTEQHLPIICPMHVVWFDDKPYLHGSPKGQRAISVPCNATFSTVETLAAIPSYFTHPERACPATTFYRSAQFYGKLTRVTDHTIKAQALQALMTTLQPEGGYRPITVGDKFYKNAIKGIDVMTIESPTFVGKAKLGQQLKQVAAHKLMDHLWTRGDTGDAAAIEAIRMALPERDPPAFLTFETLPGATFCCHLNAEQRKQAAQLCQSAYWNTHINPKDLAGAWAHSQATVGMCDAQGHLIACARATGDRRKRMWIYDVLVIPKYRGKGIGRAMMQLLLNHPDVRHAQVLLGTQDAQSFYANMGFVDIAPKLQERGVTQMAYTAQ